MFKDFKYKYLGFYSEKYNYEITIIDSEFDETTISSSAAVTNAIIKIYSSRSLNVPYNMFLFMLNYEKRYYWPIKDQILWYKEYAPKYQQYISKIEKYLLLK